MKFPKIKINVDRCTQPEDCRKCVQICPPSVLNITFRDEDFHDPKEWFIDPVFPQLCLGLDCSKCVEVCPVRAITIKLSY